MKDREARNEIEYLKRDNSTLRTELYNVRQMIYEIHCHLKIQRIVVNEHTVFIPRQEFEVKK